MYGLFFQNGIEGDGDINVKIMCSISLEIRFEVQPQWVERTAYWAHWRLEVTNNQGETNSDTFSLAWIARVDLGK